MHSSVAAAIATIQRGGIVIVVDEVDPGRGDLVMAAQAATAESIGFLVRHTSGMIRVALERECFDRLGLPLTGSGDPARRHTTLVVSVDAVAGVSTGASAADRAATIRALADPRSQAADFAGPGHVFPIRYDPGGVLCRAGHAEAAADLARLAGMSCAGVLSEVVNDDGSVARVADLRALAATFDIPVVSVAELIAYRRATEVLVRRVAEAAIPTAYGPFTAFGYESTVDGSHHIALVRGAPEGKMNVMVRLHPGCLIGDAFGSLDCNCGARFDTALRTVAEEGEGVVVYLRACSGLGIGKAHVPSARHDVGRNAAYAAVRSFTSDARDHATGAQILTDLGLRVLRLLSTDLTERMELEAYGLRIVEHIPLRIASVARAAHV